MSKPVSKRVTAPKDRDRHCAERAARFMVREFLHEYSTLPRVRRCSFRPIDRGKGVAIAQAEGVAHFRGVQLCGSIHSCPVCAPKIREGRADEINTAAVAHLDAGGGLAFATLTLRHGQGDDLRHLIDTCANGWRRIWQGRAAKDRRTLHGIDGYVRALDFTHSPTNGWHPHLHVLLFLDSPTDAQSLSALRSDLHSVWDGFAQESGLGSVDPHIGVKVDPVTTRPELGGYLAKINDRWHAGRELSRADYKSGKNESRTPWQILRDAQDNGDAEDLRLWIGYEAATLGRRAITWSRGLKARYAVEEVQDQDLADAEVEGSVVVAEMPTDVWAKLRRRRGFTVQLLEAAELGGFVAVVQAVADVLGPAAAAAIRRPPDPGPDQLVLTG